MKIDLEDQYANGAKNTLAASIKKTVRSCLVDFYAPFHSETRFRRQIPESIQQ